MRLRSLFLVIDVLRVKYSRSWKINQFAATRRKSIALMAYVVLPELFSRVELIMRLIETFLVDFRGFYVRYSVDSLFISLLKAV